VYKSYKDSAWLSTHCADLQQNAIMDMGIGFLPEGLLLTQKIVQRRAFG
jgi:hypothetical protein